MYKDLISYSNIPILLVMFYLHKPHYLKLILAISYGLIYLLYCADLMNKLIFNLVHLIIVLITLALIFIFYKDYKNEKENKLN